jgi:hypothetical protein
MMKGILACRHTSRFLVMWLAFLPFSLWDACHWVTIPAAGIIAFLLLGIEEIGVQIEEPFGILPLGRGPCILNGILSQNTKCKIDLFCP